MRRILTVLALVLSILFISGCTANSRARKYGGTVTVDLPKGQKLVTATWKDDNSLWYLTRASKPGEMPERLEFVENSGLGMMEGKVIFIEH